MKSSSDNWVLDKWWRALSWINALVWSSRRHRPLCLHARVRWCTGLSRFDWQQQVDLTVCRLLSFGCWSSFFYDNYRRGLHPIWSGMSELSTCPPAQRALQHHTQTLNVGRRCWWKQQAWQDYPNKTSASSFYYIQMNTVCCSHCS